MIRNLKVLLLAGLALLALGALGASSASAHEAPTATSKFTNTGGGNTLVTTEIDGAAGSTTAHHVFDVEGNGAITCKAADLQGTVSVVEPAEIVLSDYEETKKGFTECTFLGQTATVQMHKCDFTFLPNGTVSVVGCEGNKITFTIGNTTTGQDCTVEVGEQTLVGVAKYATVGTKVTAEVATTAGAVTNVTAKGPLCLKTGTTLTGTYTTGNTILAGESDDGLKTAKTIAYDVK